jgi:NAD(P)-dependent dehydrogenase (short-subunit alcohol dehydrogenase family)
MATWLITGCSSGLGEALAEAVLAHGDNVVATARDRATVEWFERSHPDAALATALDVTDGASIGAAIEAAEDRFGAIDVLVNNAGYGYRGAVEEGDEEDVQRLFATNFFGPVAMIKAVLPAMRARRGGTIVNVSSIGARSAPAGSGYYTATKAALEGMTASLRSELEPLGIAAFVVEPGQFRTAFAGRSLVGSDVVIDDYADTVGPRRKENDTADGTQTGDPAKAAAAIIEVVEAQRPPFLLVLGPDAQARFRATMKELEADLDAWEELGAGTSFAE